MNVTVSVVRVLLSAIYRGTDIEYYCVFRKILGEGNRERN